jgi:hypothetical protein
VTAQREYQEQLRSFKPLLESSLQMPLNLTDFGANLRIIEVLLHPFEDRSDNTTNNTTLSRLLGAFLREILLNLVGKTRNR